MKTMKGLLLILLFALTACEFVTVDDDDDFLPGTVFEIEGDFTAGNDFRLYYEFPGEIEVYESDVVLVYILWEQVNGTSGQVTDVWRLLPQTIVLEEGILQYNFDYTVSDVQIFLDGSIDLNTLLPAEALDQVFRIVIVPAEFAMNKSVDLSNYNLVVRSLGLNLQTVEKFDLSDSSIIRPE